MKKILLTLGALALSLGSSFAQNSVRKAAEDAAAYAAAEKAAADKEPFGVN